MSSPADSPIQALHGQQATIQIPQAPLGNANSALNAQAGTGTKALLAKKLAKGTYVICFVMMEGSLNFWKQESGKIPLADR